jgi:hypothetical protein
MTEFIEYFNNIKANYIIENYEQLKNKFRPESIDRLNNIDIDPLTLFKKYINKSWNYKNDISVVSVKYTQSNNIGRHFAKHALSLQSLPREIRQTICSEYYIDIDIKNCHPVILSQYAEKNNLSNKYLNKYINERDNILNKYSTQFNVSKADVKKSFLSILNGGNKFLTCQDSIYPSFVSKFKDEIIKIQHFVFENEPTYKKLGIINAKKKQDILKSKSANVLGSTMNIMLCDIENNILQHMINYLDNKNIIHNDVVLVFDGFQILKDNIKKKDIDINKLIIELEKDVYKKLNYNIKLDIKEMNDIIEVPNDYKPFNKIKEDNEQLKELKKLEREEINKRKNTFAEDYDEKKRLFELKYFKINNPISFGHIDHKGDFWTITRQELITKEEDNIIKKYNKQGEIIGVPFVLEWLKDNNKRVYECVEFQPMIDLPPNIFNTFTGYKIHHDIKNNPDKEKLDFTQSKIYHHLKYIICNGNEEAFIYIMMVFSRILKNPTQPTNTLELIKSLEGIGKDLVLDYFGIDIIGGKYYLNTNRLDEIFGQFNDLCLNKVLIVLNEINGGESFKIMDAIKARITAINFNINTKGIKQYKIKNCVHMIAFTNNDNSIKISPDDRRFVCIEGNGLFANNKDYFKDLIDEMRSGKYNQSFYHYLMNLDSDNFNFTNERPTTNLYNEMQELNIPPFILFLKYIVINNITTINGGPFYQKYCEFLTRHNYLNYKLAHNKFGINIKKLSSYGIEYSGKESAIRKYIINIDILKEYLITKYKIDFTIDDFIPDFID